jgi:hypothetical protein
VKCRRAERAEEDVGAEPFERRPVGRRQLQERLEEPVQAPARAQEAPGLFHVDVLAESLENGALRNEWRYGGLGFGLHEQMDLVRVGPLDQGLEKVQDEDAHPSVAAVRRQGCEIDEDPQPSPL